MSTLTTEAGTRALPTVAARTVDATKVYGKGQAPRSGRVGRRGP